MPAFKNRLRFLTPKRIQQDKPLFVFLPGMDGTGQLLQSQTEDLGKIFDLRCLVIPPDDLNDWDILSAHVVELVKAELQDNPQRSVYLCGESFGGCLLLKVALRAPKLFDRIILVNPASSFSRRSMLRWGAQLLPWMPEFIYRGAALMLLPFLVSWRKVEQDDRRALMDAMASVPPRSVGWRLSLLGEFRIEEEELSRLTQPVLLLAGDSDRLLPSVWEVEHLKQLLANAKIAILPGSGHACLLEADVNLYEILQEQQFLESDLSLKVS